jgi:hypothetical protein
MASLSKHSGLCTCSRLLLLLLLLLLMYKQLQGVPYFQHHRKKNKKAKQKLLFTEPAQYVHHCSQYTNLAVLSNDQETVGPGILSLGCCNVQEHRLAGTMLGILHPRSGH